MRHTDKTPLFHGTRHYTHTECWVLVLLWRWRWRCGDEMCCLMMRHHGGRRQTGTQKWDDRLPTWTDHRKSYLYAALWITGFTVGRVPYEDMTPAPIPDWITHSNAPYPNTISCHTFISNQHIITPAFSIAKALTAIEPEIENDELLWLWRQPDAHINWHWYPIKWRYW